jgi:lipopolysaccharide biosynthesis glycosyltransferase
MDEPFVNINNRNSNSDTIKAYNSMTTSSTKSSDKNDSNGNNIDNNKVDNKQRALVILCLGESAINSNYVERFVWSARNVGRFNGWIVLISDAPEDRYKELLDWTGNNKFTILRPEEEHYIRHYAKGPAMVYKQFKTYVLQYLSKDSRLDEIELVYYLDVDIVFGNSVWPLFHDLERRYQIGSSATNNNSNENNQSSVAAKMWMFEGNYKQTKIQGGQMILDRTTSQPCLERFRSLMDPKTTTIDQVLLMQMIDDQEKAARTKDNSLLKCEIVIMPQEERHIIFPTRKYMKKIADRPITNVDHSDSKSYDSIPVLNHIKNTGADLKRLSPEDLEAYLRFVMRFEHGQEDVLGITAKTYLDEGQRDKGKKKQKLEEKEVSVLKKNQSTIIELQPGNQQEENSPTSSVDKDGVTTNDGNDGDGDTNNKVVIVDQMATLSSAEVEVKMKELDYVDDIGRAFVVISMGEIAAETKTVERFVYSARNAGKYPGWIVVITDAPPGRYSNISNWADNVIIMEPEKEHIKTHYKTSNMIYKRFKTLVIEYVGKDSRLDGVELVYYLDVDIVFGNSMWPAFHGLEETYRIGPQYAKNDTNVVNSLPVAVPRGRMFMFKGNSDKWQIQGGQMVLDRSLSSPCLDLWRKKFDAEKTAKIAKDQYLLMAMLKEQQDAKDATLPYECEIVSMSQYPYIEFPLVKVIKERSKFLRKHPRRTYPTCPMVHVRNDGGTADMKEGMIRPYMTNLLRFKQNQKDPLGILKKVEMEHEKLGKKKRKSNQINR